MGGREQKIKELIYKVPAYGALYKISPAGAPEGEGAVIRTFYSRAVSLQEE